jgi:hypothetical protein
MSFFSQVLIKLFSFPSPLFMFHYFLLKCLLILRVLSDIPEHIRVILPQLTYLLLPLPYDRVPLPPRSGHLLHLHLHLLLYPLLIHLLLRDYRQPLLHLIRLTPAHIELLLEYSEQVLLLVTLTLDELTLLGGIVETRIVLEFFS